MNFKFSIDDDLTVDFDTGGAIPAPGSGGNTPVNAPVTASLAAEPIFGDFEILDIQEV